MRGGGAGEEQWCGFITSAVIIKVQENSQHTSIETKQRIESPKHSEKGHDWLLISKAIQETG